MSVLLIARKHHAQRPLVISACLECAQYKNCDYQTGLHIQNPRPVGSPLFVDTERILLQSPLCKNRIHMSDQENRLLRPFPVKLTLKKVSCLLHRYYCRTHRGSLQFLFKPLTDPVNPFLVGDPALH